MSARAAGAASMMKPISAAAAARGKICDFIFLVLDDLSVPPGGMRRPRGQEATRSDRHERRSDQISRGMIGRWTCQTLGDHVVERTQLFMRKLLPGEHVRRGLGLQHFQQADRN